MMLYEEREEKIMEQLQLQPVVRVGKLSEQLKVSVDTIRRDLKSMEKKGLIKYVHGGACLPDKVSPYLNFNGREIVHIGLKRKVAEKALPLIRPGMTIALNSGTTNLILAQEMLKLGLDITVVSNNIAAISILMQSGSIHLISIGGEVDNQERSTYGFQCETEFRKYYPDITFLAVNAVNCSDGFTDFRFHEIGIMNLLAENSEKVYAVMDASKLGKRSKRQVFPKSAVDAVIMDDPLSDEVRQKYEQEGIHII